ncbi:MAG TPA: hypothetical protein V6C72_10130, partial [Chroococcales cyanobacterium]
MTKGGSVCLNTIVKDESAIVERMIDSVAPHVDYYVVCDTGSTDDTVERVRGRFFDHGVDGEIHSIPFIDFAQARNAALDHARASKREFSYFLLADADMELVVDQPDFAASLSRPAYSAKMQCGTLGYYNTRLIHRDSGATYIGATHEYLAVKSLERVTGVRFIHHADGSSRKEKVERDLKLLLEMLEKDPDDSRAMFYMARTLHDAERYQEAAAWYEMRTRAGGSPEERWYAR